MEIEIAVETVGVKTSAISPETACNQQISIIENPSKIVTIIVEEVINRKLKTEGIGYAETGNQILT